MLNKQLIDVVILAGGFGSRLQSRLGILPKPMVNLCGKPALEYQITSCRDAGFTNIYLLVHYNHEVISDYFGEGSKWGVTINYLVEIEPRGTGGALFDALPKLQDTFLVLYGDTYLDVDFSKFVNYHLLKNSEATIFVHPNNHPIDSDLIEVDENSMVVDIHPYPHELGKIYRNLVNAALYVISKSAFKSFTPEKHKYDIAKDIFPQLVNSKTRFFAYQSQEYIKDLGTPERLDKVTFDIKSGVTEKLSLRNKRSAVFIDRDGTIINLIDQLNNINDVTLLEGASTSIKKLNKAGKLAVCITNQPVVARGELSLKGLDEIHAKIDHLLGDEGAYLDKLYFCPHHPDSGFLGEVKELKISCECRKPNIGMIERAISELDIDKQSSWFIGDTTIDIQTGINAGLKTILVKTGLAGMDDKYNVQPNYVFPDLNKAADWIINGQESMKRLLVPIIDQIVESKYVLIGGLAHSGKSTFAELVKEYLFEKGFKAHVISLDGWIFPVDQRAKSGSVLQRYDFDKINMLIDKIRLINSSQKFQIPIYNRKLRNSQYSKDLEISPQDIIIIEGVPALTNINLNNIARLKIFVNINEKVRKERFFSDYRVRGFKDFEIDEIFNSRAIDEHKLILDSKSNASCVIDL